MTHLHLAAAADGGLLATTADTRFAIDLPAARLASSTARETLRKALAEVVDDPVDWAPPSAEPPGPHAEILLPGQPRRRTCPAVWWYGGAWYAARGDDVDAAMAVLRTGASDRAVAQTWESPSLRIGLPTLQDVRIERLAEAVDDLERGWMLRNGDGAVTQHRIAPWPDLDPITGICRRISDRPPEPGFPSTFRHLHATLPRTELNWPEWQADRLAPAALLVTPSCADGELRERAVASAVAHLAGPWCRATIARRGSPEELRAAGVRVLDPALLTVADPALGAHPDSPLPPIRGDQEQWWVPARRLSQPRPVWAPIAFTHTYSDPPALPDQPVLGYHNLAGAAAARTVPAAVSAGLRHVLSLDAVARWWRSCDAPAPPALAVPARLRDAWGDAMLELELRLLPSRFEVPVVLAVVRDRERAITTLGHAAGDPIEAAMKAAAEALLQLASARDLLDPDGLIRHSAALGAGTAPGLLEHRPRRDYLNCAPTRSSGTAIPARPALTDAMAHLQVGLDPRLQRRLHTRLGDPPPARPPSWPGVAELVHRGVPVHVVTLTPPPLRHSGWHAVRVLVPGCLRLEPAALPIRAGVGNRPEHLPYPGW
ncbi:YcaO-like family protein [Micropruina sp.]|uniref:YcaO-like family protein n=1 Tax=Micropruina sp. TaxID=2737536 RepID=UPI0039E57065